MDIYLGGAEIPGWRNLLAREGVEHVALSFMGLRRRTRLKRPWLLDDKFDEGQKIFLDSGAYTVNRDGDEDKYTIADLRDIADSYKDFVTKNIDRIDFVTEFDALSLGREWIEDERDDFWDSIPRHKFMPVWHEQWGLESLYDLAETYERIGITQTSLNGRNLTPVLNTLASRGIKLHGIAMTRPDEMRAVHWSSVASMSWLSPSQYGDTIVWTGRELKRYPKKMKDQARKRHRTHFQAHGFDPELIEADDTTEMLRLSIWSWLKVAEDVSRHQDGVEVVATSRIPHDGQNAETAEEAVDTQSEDERKTVATIVPREESERQVLPGLSFSTMKRRVLGDDGEPEEREIALMETRSSSNRMCDSCFLSTKCPAFKPQSNCAYEIPITVRTPEQAKALQESLIEMQAQRVAFMKFVEDAEGGYADPNLSGEVDRLNKMMKLKSEMEEKGFSLTIQAKGDTSKGGILSQLFGADAGERATALPEPLDVERVALEGGFVDAEIVD